MYPWQQFRSMVFLGEVHDDCKGRQMDSLWELPLSSSAPFLRKPLLKMRVRVCMCETF